MGFVFDTAITTNADVLKYAFEQQLANLLRSANTYDELHKGVTNTLIAEFLRPRGFTTAAKLAAIANVDDFKPALTFLFLSRVFAGQAQGAGSPAQREAALNKSGYYLTEYTKSLGKLIVDPGDSTIQMGKGLPYLVNVDGGSMYPALGSSPGRPGNVASTTIPNFDDQVVGGI